MASIRLAKRKVSDKVSMKFDIRMLNTLIKYVLDKNLQQINVINLYSLFDRLDMDTYAYNQQIYDRVLLIKYIADAKANHSLKEPDLISSYVLSKDGDLEDIINEINWHPDQLVHSESNFIAKNVSERLQYIYLFQSKDIILEKYENIERGEFISYFEIVADLKRELSQLLVKLQNTAIGTSILKEFSFSDPRFFELIELIVDKAKKPSAILQTGMRQFNALLSPGFQSGRLYTILGLTGKFKSGMLLNITDQIRRFNPQINPVEDGKRKTILFVTMENSIEETVERLYDMYSDVNDELRSSTPQKVIDILRTRGNYRFTDTEGIDIDLRYFSNLQIKTCDLYAIVQDLEDNGKKVIALVLDYLKRIDSTFNSMGDERTRLSYVSKELKSLAQYFQIPVITAMQVNREGNSIIDSAAREGKEDLLNFIGAGQIGNCWDIAEESDWMCMINLERQRSSGKLFLSVKRLKIRAKKDQSASEYFNHPFINEKDITLATDVDKPNTLSIISLSNDLETINQEDAEKKLLKFKKDKDKLKEFNIMQTTKITDFNDDRLKRIS